MGRIIANLTHLAFKNLWRRKLRTFLTVSAVSIGTAAVVSLVAITSGAKNIFLQQMEKTGALTEIIVTPSNEIETVDLFNFDSRSGEGEKITAATVAAIKKIDHVKAVSPQLRVHSLSVLQLVGGKKKYRLEVIAFDPLPALHPPLLFGRGLQKNEKNKIVLGYKTAQALAEEKNIALSDLVGKEVILFLDKGHFTATMPFPEEKLKQSLVPQTTPFPSSPARVRDPLAEVINQVRAEVIAIGLPGPKERENYISLSWGRELLVYKNLAGPRFDEKGNFTGDYEVNYYDEVAEQGYPSLLVKVDQAAAVSTVAQQIQERLGRGTITAQDFLQSFLKLFTVIQVILGGIASIALLVAALGIINTMLMAILERRREIGLLKALGANKQMITLIFLLEAGLIGLGGGVEGLGGGIAIAWLVQYFVQQRLLEQDFALERVVVFPFWLWGGALLFSFFLGILSGFYPAWRAARTNPIEALRSE